MERGAGWQSKHLINSKRRLEKKKKKDLRAGPPLAVFWLKSRGLRQSNWKSLKFGMSRHLFELRLWEKFLSAPESLLKNSVHLHSERRQWLDAEGQTDMIQGFIFFVSFFFFPTPPTPPAICSPPAVSSSEKLFLSLAFFVITRRGVIAHYGNQSSCIYSVLLPPSGAVQLDFRCILRLPSSSLTTRTIRPDPLGSVSSID